MGTTEINEPLLSIFKAEPIAGYPKQVFLLTDGDVYDTEKVVKTVALNNKYSRVHTIGVGNGCSQ